MQETSALDRLYQSARFQSISRLAHASAPETAKHVKLDEVYYIVKSEEQFPKHALTEDELPFDRLLLAISPTYRQTRVLAHQLGVQLVRELKTESRSFYEFSTNSDTVGFSPIRREILWSLNPSRNANERWKSFKLIRKLATPVYHELNHAIFYRLIRFSKPYPKRYLYFTEALAWMRDRELSEELGPASLALLFTATLYQAAAVKFIPGRFDEEKFRALLYMTYSRYMGNKNFGNLWKPDDWQELYLKSTSKKVILPKLADQAKHPVLMLSPIAPSALRTASAQSAKIHAWYRSVFKSPHIYPITHPSSIKRLFTQGVY